MVQNIRISTVDFKANLCLCNRLHPIKIVASASGGFKLVAGEFGSEEAARSHPLMTPAMLCAHMVSDTILTSSAGRMGNR